MKLEYLGFAGLAVLLVGGLLFAKFTGAERVGPLPAASQVIVAGTVVIEDAWVAETIGAQIRTAAYFTITNTSGVDERLVGISTPVASMAHLHRTQTENNVSTMQSTDALILPAGGSVRLAPGGLHIMILGLNGPLQAGESVPLTLSFLEAGEVNFEAPVRSRAEMMEAGQ